MKNVLWLSVVLAMGLFVLGCDDGPVPGPDPEPAEEPADPVAQPDEMPEPAAAQDDGEDLVPIPLTLPQPRFVGTPTNLEGVDRLAEPLGRPRPPFLAPEGVENVALNKPVDSSETFPIMGELPMIVNGSSEADESNVVELGPFEQWVAIDLEQEYEIYAMVVWRYHLQPQVYFNIVVEVSNDEEFIDSTVVFNNDHNNSLGLGVGDDMNFVETAEGQLIDCKGITGRYVRLWSEGNNQNDYNHYIEVQVFGK